MRFVFYLLLLVSLISGCKQSATKQSFSSVDSLVVHFKNEQAGEITKTIQTTETKAISRMIEFIDGKETELYDCGYDGKMYFFSKGKTIQKVDFKMKDPACNHFAIIVNGKLSATKMSDEAFDFLTALEQGMPYY